jgi:hypothetical protein
MLPALLVAAAVATTLPCLFLSLHGHEETHHA